MRQFAMCIAIFSLTISGVAMGSPIYTIGNATPTDIYFIQGQSFTPNVAGNDGSGIPTANSGGTVLLQSFSFDFVDASTAPTPLFIYATTPTVANAITGIGSIGTGTYLGGGVYSFGAGLELDFDTKYYAILPTSTNIYDGPGNPYTGGVDLFPDQQNLVNVVEGFGDFDAGFNATFAAEVPEPASIALWSLMSVAGIAAWRRRKLAVAA